MLLSSSTSLPKIHVNQNILQPKNNLFTYVKNDAVQIMMCKARIEASCYEVHGAKLISEQINSTMIHKKYTLHRTEIEE